MIGNKRVILTGITGFIGSNVCRELISRNFTIYGVRRNSSSTSRISDIENQINWINIDDEYWIEKLKSEKCDILIHSAWDGISVREREDWDLQLRNFHFSKLIFDLTASSGVKKVISFGSQAEYGLLEKKISEDSITNPVDAYGAIKLLTMHYLQFVALNMDIEWYWLRIFSVFGRGEKKEWIIPQVIDCIQKKTVIDLTDGKQIYDYLHTDDLVKNVMKVVECSSNKSGIYNLCSGRGIEIREMIKIISKLLPGSDKFLNLGKVPYRKNQNMYSVGDNARFEAAFGKIDQESIVDSLKKIITHI